MRTRRCAGLTGWSFRYDAETELKGNTMKKRLIDIGVYMLTAAMSLLMLVVAAGLSAGDSAVHTVTEC